LHFYFMRGTLMGSLAPLLWSVCNYVLMLLVIKLFGVKLRVSRWVFWQGTGCHHCWSTGEVGGCGWKYVQYISGPGLLLKMRRQFAVPITWPGGQDPSVTDGVYNWSGRSGKERILALSMVWPLPPNVGVSWVAGPGIWEVPCSNLSTWTLCLKLRLVICFGSLHAHARIPSPPPPAMAQQPLMGQILLIIEASRSHSDTPHSVGFLLTCDRPDAETFTWQNTTLTTDRYPFTRRDSNPQSHRASGPRPKP
jgi:hypothetical protein